MNAKVTISIRLGADLVEEPFHGAATQLDAAMRACEASGSIDGGLSIEVDGHQLCYPDIWDHVDGLLLAWTRALDEIRAGASEAVAVFPDTRVECELRRIGDNAVSIEYEDVAATVAMAPLQEALNAAAMRICAVAARHGVSTAALAQLHARSEAR